MIYNNMLPVTYFRRGAMSRYGWMTNNQSHSCFPFLSYKVSILANLPLDKKAHSPRGRKRRQKLTSKKCLRRHQLLGCCVCRKVFEPPEIREAKLAGYICTFFRSPLNSYIVRDIIPQYNYCSSNMFKLTV